MKNRVQSNINEKTNNKLSGKSVVLILGLVYTLISVIAVISYISRINNISTTSVTFSSIISDIWWQMLMIMLFIVIYVLYAKKTILGAVLEIIMGMAMLVYMVIGIAIVGINIFALIIELVYPLILVFHGLIEFKKISKKSKIKKSTI